jgi:hypothetical protein
MTDTTPFMEELKAKLSGTRSESTIKQMMSTLRSLNGKKSFPNLRFLSNIKAVNEIIGHRELSTQGSYYSTILNTLATQNRTKKLIKEYQVFAQPIWRQIQNRNVHEKTQKQEDSMIPMKEIVKRREELKDAVDSMGSELTPGEYDRLCMWILICLYTEIAPRRNADYAFMVVVKSLPEEQDENVNYLSLSEKKFVFNRYKTKKNYGRQTIDIPEELMAHIQKFLEYHPQRDQESYELFNTLHKVNGITRILNRAFGKKIGASALRHIYLSDRFADQIIERQEIAEAMAHSVAVADSYIKF